MRANWWSFGVWYFGQMHDPNSRLIYDLRSWLFGVRYHFGAWQINVGPVEFEKLVKMDEAAKAPI